MGREEEEEEEVEEDGLPCHGGGGGGGGGVSERGGPLGSKWPGQGQAAAYLYRHSGSFIAAHSRFAVLLLGRNLCQRPA